MRAVLERDFLAEASRRRAFLLRAAVGGAVSFVAIQHLLARGWTFGSLDPAAFRKCSWLVLGALALLTPPAMADAVLAERRANSLPLVVASPEGAVGFTLGKYFSRMGLILGVAATAVVPLSVCFLAGRFPPEAGIGFLCRVVGLVLEMGAFGILASALAGRIEIALVLALLLPAARWFGTAAAVHGLAAAGLITWRFEEWLFDASGPLWFLGHYGFPPTALGLADVPVLLRPTVTVLGGRPEPVALAVSLLFAALALALASRLVARHGAGAPRARPAGERMTLPESWPRVLDRNPILWKEVRLLRQPFPRFLVLGALGAAVLGMAWFDLRGPGRGVLGEHHVALLPFAAILLGWLAATQGAATFALEKDRGTLEALRGCPLSTMQVLRGKLLGMAFLPAAFWIVLMFHLAFLVQAGKLGPLAAAAAAMTTTAIGAAQGALGVRWGMLAPGRGPAVRGAAAIPLYSVAGYAGLLLAPYLLVVNERLEEKKQSRYLSAVGIPALLMGPPTFIVSTAIEVSQTFGVRGLRSPGFFVFLLAVVWTAITLGVLINTCSELPRLVRRELQKEEVLPVPDREPPPLKVRLEKRRLALEERRKP